MSSSSPADLSNPVARVAARTPRNTADLACLLSDPKTTFVALPLWKFSAGGTISREIAGLDNAKLLALYGGGQILSDEIRAQATDGRELREPAKVALDRLEMGRRALVEAIAERDLLPAADIAASDRPFLSAEAQEIEPVYQRDPGLHIAQGRKDARISFLENQHLNFLERLFNKQRSLSTVQVLDGDSLRLNGLVDVRLFGIDAPEMSAPGGAEAKAHLQQLAAGKTLSATRHGTCPYGRPLVRLFGNGEDLCHRMVSDGMARAYGRYSKRYLLAQAGAFLRKRGLWAKGWLKHPESYRREQARSR